MIASLDKKHGEVWGCHDMVHFYKSLILLSFRGPVAQLGARFHGMEEVKGSNPFRSTNPKRV
jgi:hypothetical protein